MDSPTPAADRKFAILLVEDNDAVRDVLARILTGEGHVVTEAINGVHARRLSESAAFDLVVTDIVMPDSDGLQLIRDWRRNMKGSKIIAISGGGRGSSADYLTLAKNLGAHDVLQKPITRQDLLETVNRVMAPSS